MTNKDKGRTPTEYPQSRITEGFRQENACLLLPKQENRKFLSDMSEAFQPCNSSDKNNIIQKQ